MYPFHSFLEGSNSQQKSFCSHFSHQSSPYLSLYNGENFRSSVDSTKTIKFLYSYSGRIVPRPTDGVLRYVGGHTRVLSVERSITFSELMVKFGESCGSYMNLTCKLPSEDLDLLVSIKSDEELRNVVAEYDKASPGTKIRAVLFPVKSKKAVSPPSSPISCFDFPLPKKPQRIRVPAPPRSCYAPPPYAAAYHCCPPAVGYPVSAAGKCRYYEGWSPRNMNNVHNLNYYPRSYYHY